MHNLFTYQDEHTLIHKLSGLTKLLALLILTITIMMSFDTRLIAVVLGLSLIALYIAKIPLKQLKLIFIYLVFFLSFNAVLTFLFDPQYGVRIYGSSTPLFSFGGKYVLTAEQLFYQFTKSLKYISVVPIGIIFVATTNPSELAASLNKIGIPYHFAVSVSLTLRYFPEVVSSYTEIKQSLEARGLAISSKDSLKERFKNNLTVMIPLIFSSLDHIESISNALDLRNFGKFPKRTWYMARPMTFRDYAVIIGCLCIACVAIYLTIFVNHGRFYNPF